VAVHLQGRGRRATLTRMALPHAVSTSDLAVVLGVNERTIRKLIDRGVLSGSDGGFDLAESVQLILPNLHAPGQCERLQAS
jgi:hypothetical protein